MKKLLQESKKLALSEIDKYGAPNKDHFDISNQQGQVLAKKYKANRNIIFLGTCLMDLKIGQAIKENRLGDHIKMSIKGAGSFLKQQKAEKDLKNAVVHCIEAHHGTTPFKSKEAEIVANADCYRFLTPKGFLVFVNLLGKRGTSLKGTIDYAERKVDEKWKIASLPEVKKELKPYYLLIKKLLKEARKQP